MKCTDCGCEFSEGEYRINDCHELWADCAEALIKRALTAESEIAELKEQNRWRKYPDEKPEDNMLYSIRGKYNSGQVEYSTVIFRSGYFVDREDLQLNPDFVTHWRPLPEPPSEVE